MISNSTKGLALALLLASGASQAGIWAPSNPSVSNFFDNDTLMYQFNIAPTPSTNVFGIFDDTETNFDDAHVLLTFTGSATVNFKQVSGSDNWMISLQPDFSSNEILDYSNHFQIGFNRAGTWETEVNSQVFPLIDKAWQLSFGQGQGKGVTLYALNVEPSTAIAPPAVPLPPAAWLMGSALLGLIGVSKRKKIA